MLEGITFVVPSHFVMHAFLQNLFRQTAERVRAQHRICLVVVL